MITDRLTVWEITEPLSRADAVAFHRHFKDLFTAYFIRQGTKWVVVRLAENEMPPLSHLRIVHPSDLFPPTPEEKL